MSDYLRTCASNPDYIEACAGNPDYLRDDCGILCLPFCDSGGAPPGWVLTVTGPGVLCTACRAATGSTFVSFRPTAIASGVEGVFELPFSSPPGGSCQWAAPGGAIEATTYSNQSCLGTATSGVLLYVTYRLIYIQTPAVVRVDALYRTSLDQGSQVVYSDISWSRPPFVACSAAYAFAAPTTCESVAIVRNLVATAVPA